METPQGNAITFENAFIENATRAAVDPSTKNGQLTAFDVWGFVKAYDGTVFNDTDVTLNNGVWGYEGTQFWAPNQPYYFAALAPMNSNKIGHTLATGDAAKLGLGTITFENENGTEDLLYAKTQVISKDLNVPNEAVKFQFQHLLSKVKFTFKNGFITDNASIKVTNIQLEAPASAAIDVAQEDYSKAWILDNEKVTLAFGDVEQLAYGAIAECADERLTIPTASSYVYTVKFNVELFIGAQSVYSVNKTSTVTGVELEMGKGYNFSAEINPDNLELDAITFDVIEVEDWEEAGDVPTYVGTTEYVSSAAEFAAAVNNPEVAAVVLNNDIELTSTLTRAGEEETVITKSFVLDGNGKTLTYTGTGGGRVIDIRSDVENETYKNVTIKNLTIYCTGSYVERGINYNANGTLVLDGVKLTGTAPSYAVNLPGLSDNAAVTIKNSELTGLIALNVWGENMRINVENSVLTSVDPTEVENYSAVKLNNDGSTIANGTIINIKNSTIVALDEKGEPSTALYNATDSGQINVDESTEVVGGRKEQVAIVYYSSNPNQFYGCVSLASAIKKAVESNATGIRITKDFELDEPVEVAKDKTVAIDLNGKTISAIDETTANYQLIKNAGTLTIFGGGKMTVKATVNSEWNRYSAVIANTVGGNLTVKDVEIEHLGGTDMAYGIDNLTNGKGTYAVATIEGAKVKSPYRAVRQFLNGTEATNELYVKAGSVLEGTNKSIFFHDPSKNANTGKLVVEANAQLKGDVYLYVTAGSTEWPVEVSIAESALVNSTVTYGNVPAGYMVVNKDGNWSVVGVKTAANATELSAAISEAVGEATIVLAEGTYNMPSIGGKDITLVGTKNIVINTGRVSLGEGNLTLEGVTVKAGSYQGFQHSNVVTYNNVTVEGELYCYAEKDIFNNCTFVLNNQYVWAYGSENIEFNNCVFETNGKAILVYNEGDGATNVTVKNCTFNATSGAKAGAIANQNCAAIEIDNFQSSGVGAAHNVTASGNTFSENFSGEWRIKNCVAGNAITVNGTEYTQIAVDGKLMTIDANRNVTVLE